MEKESSELEAKAASKRVAAVIRDLQRLPFDIQTWVVRLEGVTTDSVDDGEVHTGYAVGVFMEEALTESQERRVRAAAGTVPIRLATADQLRHVASPATHASEISSDPESPKEEELRKIVSSEQKAMSVAPAIRQKLLEMDPAFQGTLHLVALRDPKHDPDDEGDTIFGISIMMDMDLSNAQKSDIASIAAGTPVQFVPKRLNS